MIEVVEIYIPDYVDWLGDFMSDLAPYFGAGILVCFIFWVIAFLVDAVFGLLAESRE